uniref:Formin-J n=1 Tax=Zeugodacus cucurbitae TaxID=28588 RepID=A0A0A1X2J9_ZEUCU
MMRYSEISRELSADSLRYVELGEEYLYKNLREDSPRSDTHSNGSNGCMAPPTYTTNNHHQHLTQHEQEQQQQQQQAPQQSNQEPSSYEQYYSVYDDDLDLYRDIEYQQQQQQQEQQQQQYQPQPQQPVRQQPVQQSTYRPLEILTTPAPQVPLRETYQPQEKPTYNNQQSLIYNTDYDEDLIAQIEQDNVYDQPTRPPTRTNSNNNRNRGSSPHAGQERDTPTAVTSNRGTHPPRTRPTLKPSGTIVSKAQEFVDIYRYPPARPEPLYPQPTPDKTAAKCRKDVCLLPDCACGGKDIPGGMNVSDVPQMVLITFDDAISTLNIDLYEELFNNKSRFNPNGCPLRATFYVSHEWTDYGMVQDLYSDGHEMASHTVSHSFGEQFSQKKWTREIAGQREILAAYGGVKLSDVRGMRAPFLSVGGNKMYKMLYDSNFTYDSSLPVYENRPPSWPYTFDYKIFHDCMIPPCPTRSYPGVWQVPMVMWQDLNGGRCSMGDACSNPSEAEGVTKMIMKNFERHYTTNRAPFGLYYHAAWFTQPHHKEGFIKFLDTINQMPDVWIVTNWQMLQWVRDPTPISRMNSFQPFQCDYSDRPKRCNNPKVCNLWHKSGVRYMKTCQPCPDIYPWTGKSGIRSSRIDNEIEDSTA